MWRVFGVGLDRALLRPVVSAALCLVLTFAAEGQEHAAVSNTVRLKRGEALVLVLLTPLDSGSAQVGDDVSLKLLLPLTVEGVNILPDGWPVHGRVSDVTRAGRNCKAGSIVWKPNEITAPDGTKVAISLGRAEKKAGKRIKETVKYAALAPLALPTLPYLVILWGGMHGEGGCRGAVGVDEKLTAGTALSAEVSKETVLPWVP
jgi:hypothetical protein